MEPRATDPQGMAGGQRHRHAEGHASARDHAAAHAVSLVGPERVDARAYVVGGHHRVAIHADDHIPAGLMEGEVDGHRHDPSRIVEHADGRPLALSEHAPDDVPRAVVGHAIHDQDLHPIGRVILDEQRAERLFDVAGLVANGKDNRHERMFGRMVSWTH